MSKMHLLNPDNELLLLCGNYPPNSGSWTHSTDKVTCKTCRRMIDRGDVKVSEPVNISGMCSSHHRYDGKDFKCQLNMNHHGSHYDPYQGAWSEGRFPEDSANVKITLPEGVPERTREIISHINPALELFIAKQRDYTNSGGHIGDNFGFMGQYMKMHDKVAKLRKPLWDNEILKEATPETSPLQFEDTREILYDLVGHILLTLSYLGEQDD